MRRRLLALLLAVAGVGCLLVSPPARAASVVATGWWSRTATTDPLSESPQAPPVQITTPDTVPVGATVGEGQLLVEGIPDGATAVAAVRWQLAPGESSPSLTLPISPGSSVNPSSVVLACRAGVAWTPPEPAPGRWEAKPLTDPRACVNGIIADDLSTISFGLQPLVRKDVLDVVLVPGRVADVPELPLTSADGSSFHWVFDAPTVDSLHTIAGSGFEQGTGSVVVTVAPLAHDTAAGGATGPSAPAASPTPSSRSFTPSAASPSPAGDSSTAAVPALDSQDLAAPVAGAQDVQLAADLADSRPHTVGIVLLLLAAAFAAWAYLSPESPELATVGLGRFRRPAPAAPGTTPATAVPEPTVGGLGRFARPRDEPPVPVN